MQSYHLGDYDILFSLFLILTLAYSAQSALYALCYLDNPVTEATSEDEVYILLDFVDSRDRLQPQYKVYPGYSSSFIPTAIRVSALATSAAEGEKALLLKAIKELQSAYQARNTMCTALLAIQPELGEMLRGSK